MVAGRSVSRYSLPLSAVKSMRRSMASIRVSWPWTMFSQVGEVASSKSAIHTWAPELRALTAIRRSGGPVISTRRSVRPGAGRATCQSGSVRIDLVAREKSSGVPPRSRAERRRRSVSRSKRRAAKAASSRAMKSRASGVRTSSWRSPGTPRTWTRPVVTRVVMRVSSAGCGRDRAPAAGVGAPAAGRDF